MEEKPTQLNAAIPAQTFASWKLAGKNVHFSFEHQNGRTARVVPKIRVYNL
jgi:hypothetical protein